MAANYSSLDEECKKTILEVFKMAQPFQDFYQELQEEAKKEGKKEGREEVITLLLKGGMSVQEVEEKLGMKISQVAILQEE